MKDLTNFYFKKSDTDDVYDNNGNYASLLDYVGRSSIDDQTVFPLCDFFNDYNNENTEKIREFKETPENILTIDPDFVTVPLWDGKTYKAGINCKPAKKYDIDVLSRLYMPTNPSPTETISVNTTISDLAGLLLLQAGGGGGGGGDAGGLFDEPSGGGGGGSGGFAIVYYRYKTTSPTQSFSIEFSSTSAASGGSAEKTGSTGASIYLKYGGATIITCAGGGGGVGSNTNDTNNGGSGGSYSYTATEGCEAPVLIDNDELFLSLILISSGVSGQKSGQSGASGKANSIQLTIAHTMFPTVVSDATFLISGSGGSGGKASSSDPGGGGGAGSAVGNGGNGAGGTTAATAGGYGAGGGGGAERSTGGKAGGRAICYRYNRI